MRVLLRPVHASPERFFPLCAVSFGLLFLLATAPFQAPDEHDHFFRAFQVSEGGWAPSREGPCAGARLPRSLAETAEKASAGLPFHPERKQDPATLRRLAALPLAPEDRLFVPISTSAYLPVPYLPQAAGILAGRALGLSPLLLHYAGRMANLAAWTALVLLSIRVTPAGRWVFLLLALTPMSLFQAASLSADAPTNGLAFLLTALFFREAWGESGPVSWRRLALLGLLSFLLALMKQAYVGFPLLFLLIPRERFPSPRLRWCAPGVVLLASGLAIGGWYACIWGAFHPPGAAGTPASALEGILSDPSAFLGEMASAYLGPLARLPHSALDDREWPGQLVGLLGWSDVLLPARLKALVWALLLCAALMDGAPSASVDGRGRAVIAASLAASLAALYAMVHLSGPLGGGRLRGRYLIPLSPLLLSLLQSRTLGIRIMDSPLHRVVLFAPPLILAWTVRILVERYWGQG